MKPELKVGEGVVLLVDVAQIYDLVSREMKLKGKEGEHRKAGERMKDVIAGARAAASA